MKRLKGLGALVLVALTLVACGTPEETELREDVTVEESN